MDTLSYLAHRLELFATSLPSGYAIQGLQALCGVLALASLWAMWEQLRMSKAHKTRGAAAAMAYANPQFVRLTQSPTWFGVLPLAMGLGFALWSAQQVDPRMKAWAIHAERAKSADPRLVEVQTAWAATLKTEYLPQLMSIPARATEADITAVASAMQSRQRTQEGLGLALALLGAVIAIRFGTREALGPDEHGQAALATRGEVIYDPKGTWGLPMRVDQRGSRKFEKISSQPVTIARPPLKSQVVHTCGTGASGSGKGANLGGHIFATTPDDVPIFYFDYKGECPAFQLRPQMLRWGFPGERPKGLPSMRFNFMEWVRTHEDPDTAATALASAILPQNAQRESDNAWIKDTAIPILANGIKSGRWDSLAELADEVEHTPLKEMLENLEIGRGRQSAFEGRNVPEYAQNTISNNTAAYLSGRARHLVSGNDFTLDEAFRRGMYIMGQVSGPGERKALDLMWSIFWAELLRKSEPMPGIVFIDEAVANGPIPRVKEALVTLRDREIQLIQFFQARSGISAVYGKDADVVWDAHQTHIMLTKGLNTRDIEHLAKIAGTYTVPGKGKNENAKKTNLFPFDALKNICRQERYFAYIDGVGWTKSGRPIWAELLPIEPSGWNWRATPEAYKADLALYRHGVEIESAFKMCREGTVELVDPKTKELARFAKWVPVYPEVAARKGVSEKHVPIADDDAYEQLKRRIADAEAKATEKATKQPEGRAESLTVEAVYEEGNAADAFDAFS